MSVKKLSGKALVIQLTRDHLRIAKTALGTAMPQILVSDVYDLPEGAVEDGVIQHLDAVQAVLRHALENPEYKRVKKAVFSLCTTQIISEQASMPKMSLSKLDKILDTNMDMYFPVDTQNYHLTWSVMEQTNDKGEMTLKLWAIPSGMVERYYELANGCGLSVAAIDYCAHALATAVGAGYGAEAKAKSAAGAKKGLSFGKKKEEQPEEFIPSAPESGSASDVELVLQAENDQLLMLFVQDDQVKLERIFQCTTAAEELGEVAMALDYYDSMEYGRYGTIKCTMCGSLADDLDFVERVRFILNVPVTVLPTLHKPEWTLCLGASKTDLDFGIPALNKPNGMSQINNAWQYGLILAGGVALALVTVTTLGSKTVWNTTVAGLENTQQSLQIQAAQHANYAQNYRNHKSKYDAYSSDWDTLFGAVRTYNDNLVLMMNELEQVLPKESSVVGIAIEDSGLTLQMASPTKEEAAYVIKSLRGLQYADLLGVSSLVKPSASYETAPVVGGEAVEAAPTVGSIDYETLFGILNNAEQNASGKNTEQLLQNAIESGLVTEEMIGKLLENGTIDAEMMEELVESGTIDSDMIISMVASGAISKDTVAALVASGAIDKDVVSGLLNSDAVDKDLIEDLLGGEGIDQEKILTAIFEMPPEQFDELEDTYAPVPENKYTLDKLLDMLDDEPNDGLKDRKAAIETMLTNDPIALYRFVNLFKVDMNRPTNEKYLKEGDKLAVLHEDVYEKVIDDLDVFTAMMSGDLKSAKDAIPVLVDALCQNKDTVKSAEKLMREDERLEKRYAYYLAVQMGLLEDDDEPIIDTDKVVGDIINGTIPDDLGEALLPGINDLLKPDKDDKDDSGSTSDDALMEWLEQMMGGSTGSSDSSSGIPDWMSGLLGGGTSASAEPVDDRYHFNIVLGYKQSLIDAERERKGLNYADKLDPVPDPAEKEVAG